jgi:predicted alpha/beta-fold hydrolase
MKRKKKKQNRVYKWIQYLWQFLFAKLGKLYRILSFPVFSPRSQRSRVSDSAPKTQVVDPDLMPSRWQWLRANFWIRFARPVIMRLLALPLVLFLSLVLIVFLSVRTGRTEIHQFPEGMRLFYQPVEFKSEDGTALRGWFIPSLRAEDVLEEGDKALRQKRPGVVLCHGIGSNRGQLLSLAAHLNQQGYETLLFDFRACGQSGGKTHSFGLRERNDVVAAVHFLADRSTVDRSRIAVIGQDIGGTAALGAAARDYSIRALVVADVDKDMRTAISRRLDKSGTLWDLFEEAYLRGYQSYFRVSERQLSSVRKAESLSENQSLMVIARSDKQCMKDSAHTIVTHTRAKTELMMYDGVYTTTLMDTTKVGPLIVNFLNNALGIKAK